MPTQQPMSPAMSTSEAQEQLNILASCDCCERHGKNKPGVIFGEHYAPQQRSMPRSDDCVCDCRAKARQLVREHEQHRLAQLVLVQLRPLLLVREELVALAAGDYLRDQALLQLRWVETEIVKKLRKIDAAITLQTAWWGHCRRAHEQNRVIEQRLSCMRAAQTVQVAWGEYKLNKRVNVLRRKHYLSLGVARRRSARIIQRSWSGYAQELKCGGGVKRWGHLVRERGDCRNLGEEKNLSPDDAALIFACLVGM